MTNHKIVWRHPWILRLKHSDHSGRRRPMAFLTNGRSSPISGSESKFSRSDLVNSIRLNSHCLIRSRTWRSAKIWNFTRFFAKYKKIQAVCSSNNLKIKTIFQQRSQESRKFVSAKNKKTSNFWALWYFRESNFTLELFRFRGGVNVFEEYGNRREKLISVLEWSKISLFNNKRKYHLLPFPFPCLDVVVE